MDDDLFYELLGKRLRKIRKDQNLSMSEVQHKSDGRFKVSILGAYERGERQISAGRLDALLAIYGTTARLGRHR